MVGGPLRLNIVDGPQESRPKLTYHVVSGADSSLSPPNMPFSENARRIGYEITGSPIRGGSGVLHRATDVTTGKEVAIKALAPGFDLNRLEREAKVLAKVDHPNVARLQGFEVIDGTASLIVDWVDGEPLTNVLRKNSHLSVKRSIDIFEQVANALDAAHRAGIVHRDISPSNIMIGPGDRITVIDFGLSGGTETATVTIDGTVTGTPRYVAPEVIEGAEASARSDQYSIAVLLHEMLTGSWPFPETSSVAGALHHQLHSTPKPLDEINPLLGGGLTDAVLTAVSKDPDDRFPSIQAFIDAVKDPEALTLRERSSRSYDRPTLTLGIPLIVAAILGLVLYLTLRSGGDDQAADQDTAATDQIDSADPTTSAAMVDTGNAMVATVESWQAGVAGGLDCNLMPDAGFEVLELPDNYFVDGEDLTRVLASITPTGGVDNSRALLVGDSAGDGLWGTEVPITGGAVYLFSANVSLQGDVSSSEMSVYWLDEDRQQIDESTALDIAALGTGQRTLQTAAAPVDARYAVPRFYVDESAGTLVADEVVFAPLNGGCDQLLLGS